MRRVLQHGERLAAIPSPRILFQAIAERAIVTALEAALFALALAGHDQVFQAARAKLGQLAAFGATLVALHSQLIFALPRNGQAREFVFDAGFHGVVWSA